jgi:5-methylthioadenosine/S-adenosylhomocysteine deaminase
VEENPVIFANGLVVTCDPLNRVGRFHLLVRDGRIQEIGGTLETLSQLNPAATIIDASNRVLLPGFVNAHYHTESFLLHALTDGKSFAAWKGLRPLRERIDLLMEAGYRTHMENISRAASLAHIKSGTTTVGEMPLPYDADGFDALQRAADSTGLRRVTVLQTWEQVERAREQRASGKRFALALGREEDYTVYSFENHVRTAREFECPLVAHAAEQRDDVESVRKKFQKDLCVVYRDFGALRPSTVMVHLNHATAADVALLSETDAPLVLCPYSTSLKRSGYPLLRRIAGKRLRLCVGTDWGNTDMLRELRFLGTLPTLFSGVPAFSALDLLRMATIDAAAALSMGQDVGSIEAGKRADIITVALDDIRIDPLRESDDGAQTVETLLRSATTHHIRDVMINGGFVIRAGQAICVDEQEVSRGFRQTFSDLIPSGEGKEAASRAPSKTPSGSEKIFSFPTGERGSESEAEGFVEGFAVLKGSAPVIPFAPAPAPPPRRPATPEKSQSAPSLPKDVKKVFGEDDDF